MKLKLSEILRGSVRAEISGAAPEKCLNALTDAGVGFWDAVSEDAFTVRLGMAARDLGDARAIAGRSQCSLRVLRERGAPAVRRRLRRRLALLGTAAACFVLLAASSLFVWDIDVEGNETVSTGEIMRALADCGVHSGSFWPGWSAEEIRNSVILDIPALSWVGVSVDSSRAVVRVRERIDKPEVADNDAAGSVTARATGIIERMEVYQGAPLVAVGEAVIAGETLVSGEMPSTVGDTRYVRASALVEARTWYELSAAAPLEYEAAGETGSHTRWALVIGGRRFNFYAGSSQTPPDCGKIITEYPLAWEGVFTLPVTLVRERIVEYGRTAAAEDADALAGRLSAELTETLERRLDGRGEIIDVTFTAAESGGQLVVTMRAECREDIAQFVPA